MPDALLPTAGWYADGVTPGVLRWFDGTAWTEQTMPAPAHVPARVPARLGDTSDPARDAALEWSRLAEARRVRRGAIGWFCTGTTALAVAGLGSLAMGGPGDLWILGAIAGVFCVGRAIRDYHRAVHRGAPTYSVPGFAVAMTALVLAVGVFVAAPVEAARQVSHLSHEVSDVTDGDVQQLLHQVGVSP